MSEVAFEIDKNGNGAFYITESDERIAEMIVSISGNILSANHTEVFPKGEGKGLGKQLFTAMINYARKNNLTVNAVCTFVHSKLQKSAAEYSDIWKEA